MLQCRTARITKHTNRS